MLNVVSYSGGPKGIDVPIRKFQEKIHRELMTAWGLNTANPDQNKLYESYGRVYRNRKEAGYVAEVYTGANQYKDVYWNDALNAISFFGVGQQVKHNISFQADVHLVFFVNLEKLKPLLSTRADEEVRKDVLTAAQKFNFGFKHISTETSIENVLREYPGSYREERLKNVDMHPIHCFRLNFILTYNKNDCFNTLN